jgi:hypothetical protein
MTDPSPENRITNRLLALVASGKEITRIRPDGKINETKRTATFEFSDGTEDRIFVVVRDAEQYNQYWDELLRLRDLLTKVEIEKAPESE